MTIKNYDSDFCGSIPIHQINLIQPYGFLVVLNKDTLSIVQVSENVSQIFSKSPKELIGTSIEDYFSKEAVDSIKLQISLGKINRFPLTLTLNENCVAGEYVALIHQRDEFLLLEIEQSDLSPQRLFVNVAQQIKPAMAKINSATTLGEVYEATVKELKAISGFDKVMFYTFDNDWNGTVVAEAREEDMDAYLGLKFPASDIPRQARALYQNNPYRLIPDRNFTPVQLYPVINPLTHTFIDLSDCNLRSVPAVHLEYLKNMEVCASMSTRVIVDGRLFGLISCHHRSPQHLNYEACSVFELFSDIIATKVSSIIHKEEITYLSRLQNLRAELVEQVYKTGDLFSGLLNREGKLLELFGSTGAVLFYKGRIETQGVTPGEDELGNIYYWLQGKNFIDIFAEDCLSRVYDEAKDYAQIASGVLVIPLLAEEGYYLVLFRPEVVQTVAWGGNPNEAIIFEQDKKNYHPRNSFNIWQQTLKDRSKPWNEKEVDIAHGLKSFFQDYLREI